ncbi:MAG: hypothetical protein AAFZ52_13680, partial [Bacteroidota bacterium]
MNRRNFFRTTGALSLSSLLTSGLAADPLSFFSALALNSTNDRILVLIRLAGGNDGLNTVIGLDQLDNLSVVRSNVVIPAEQVLPLTTTTGLHPSMTGMQEMYNNGLLGIVQAVGYPNQNRSHFRSTDIWTSASAANETVSTGWLGRYLDEGHPEYPTGYPNEDFPYPLAITMGNVVSETCQGINSTFSQAVRNPYNFNYIAPGGNTALPDNNYGTEVSFVRQLIGQSNAYGAVVKEAAQLGENLVEYPDNSLGDQLKNIATLISGGLGTRIYVAT